MKLKRYKPTAEEPLRKAVELDPENQLINEILADNRFKVKAMVADEENQRGDH
jgi:hypothetical protein